MKENITAIYCRLSKEDLDKDSLKPVSESIKNQKSMLEEYALERKWVIYDFYVDEDYSGSDRNRPEFNRLITDSLLGRFNIVLCKKQARFARDIEYVEKYIHGLFMERQIRFVAVLDNIDTGTVSRSSRKASQINSLVDEWYLSDLSENITAALTTKRRNAEFIGSWSPYGYRKDPNNKNALIVDADAAETVKRIFNLYQAGYGITKIAGILNSEQIPNPLRYKQLQGEKINPNPDRQTAARYLWSPSSVSAILHNQTYAGYLIQGKFKKASYKSKKLIRIPSENWIVVPGSHQAIITEESWHSVQDILRSKCRIPSGFSQRRITSGVIFCGECGKKLVSSGGRSGIRKTSYLCCSGHQRLNDSCPGARIEAEKLEQVLLDQVCLLNVRYFDISYLKKCISLNSLNSYSKLPQLNKDLSSISERISANERKLKILYTDRLEDIITQDQYLEFKKKLYADSEALEQKQQETIDLIEHAETENQGHERDECILLDSYFKPSSLTQEMVNQLIESVYVFRRRKGEPQKIMINWKF